jgi:hypothetical protein
VLAAERKMLLILIPIAIAWLGVLSFVICLCRMAAIGDAQQAPAQTRGEMSAQVVPLEHAPGSRAGARLPSGAGAHRTAHATSRRRRLVTLR